jgi:hypothetical protein
MRGKKEEGWEKREKEMRGEGREKCAGDSRYFSELC